MRLGIDAREIENGVFTGIGRSLAQFLRYFSRRARVTDSAVLYTTRPLPISQGDNTENRVLPRAPVLWWDQVSLAQAVLKDDVDVFYSPYYKIPLWAPCRKVSSVLDIMYLRYPAYVRQMGWLRRQYYAVMGRKFLDGSDRVLTCSDFSRRDIFAHYGVAPDRIDVIPLGVSAIYRPADDELMKAEARVMLGVRGRYLLYVGNFKPHKNVGIVINAFQQVAEAFPDLSLVLVGPRQPGVDASLGGRVVFAGTITDESKLRQVYAGAEIFLFPSLYEGFGIPPAEAMACGIPVICSQAASLPEVLAGAGLLVNGRDADAWAAAIRRLLGDEVLYHACRDKGLRRVEALREDIVSAQVYDLLRQVYEKPACGEVRK